MFSTCSSPDNLPLCFAVDGSGVAVIVFHRHAGQTYQASPHLGLLRPRFFGVRYQIAFFRDVRFLTARALDRAVF